MEKTYEFVEDKVQNISMDMLSKSIRQEGRYGRVLETKPVQIWMLMTSIMSMLEEEDFNYVQEKISVQKKSSHTFLSDADTEKGYNRTLAPIEKWKFDKVINLIQLPGVYEGDDEGTADARNAAIGITLNDHGISVAFGMNVKQCINFNVYGGTLLRTYSYAEERGMPWEHMEFKLRHWIKNLGQIWKVQNDIMKTMKDHELPSEKKIIQEVVGGLYIDAIKSAYYKGSVTPFNTHELSEFTQKIVKEKRDQDQLGTVWDLYNWGTSIMRPGTMDIGEIANNSNLWADHLIDKFKLDVQEINV